MSLGTGICARRWSTFSGSSYSKALAAVYCGNLRGRLSFCVSRPKYDGAILTRHFPWLTWQITPPCPFERGIICLLTAGSVISETENALWGRSAPERQRAPPPSLAQLLGGRLRDGVRQRIQRHGMDLPALPI